MNQYGLVHAFLPSQLQQVVKTLPDARRFAVVLALLVGQRAHALVGPAGATLQFEADSYRG
jgi:hypothetical protein